MIEMIEANWLIFLLVAIVALLVAMWLASRARPPRERSHRPDVLDEGVAPAKRNQALIDAPPAAHLAAPYSAGAPTNPMDGGLSAREMAPLAAPEVLGGSGIAVAAAVLANEPGVDEDAALDHHRLDPGANAIGSAAATGSDPDDVRTAGDSDAAAQPGEAAADQSPTGGSAGGASGAALSGMEQSDGRSGGAELASAGLAAANSSPDEQSATASISTDLVSPESPAAVPSAGDLISANPSADAPSDFAPTSSTRSSTAAIASDPSGDALAQDHRPDDPRDGQAVAAAIKIANEGNAADDLAKIKGVGPKLIAMLGDMGISRFDQIAAWSDEDVQLIDERLGRFKGRITRDDWRGQASLLSEGDTDSYETKFGKL